nr:integrase, catalytic region, zinc finger, CCHC-type, peptidase aspartic, catalytic [Tanacetum cinerariifolium]
SQQAATRNRGKAIVNSPRPFYDQEPSMDDDDDETSKDKEIDKLINMGFNATTAKNLDMLLGNVRNLNGQRMQLITGKDAIVKQIDQNDEDADLTEERELLASIIEKLKCEIDESKNRNKFLKTSNKVLIDKLKNEIKDFKNKNNNLELSNNQFKEVNNKLSEENDLLYADFKKSQAELKQRDSIEYASEMELECAKVIEANNKLSETNNLLYADHKKSEAELARSNSKEYASQMELECAKKEAQIKLYKTREDKELDKVIELENKVKVLDNIVYKTGQSVQTMNMLNNKCRTSFAKPEFLKKAQRANPRLHDIGCYNENLALMLAPDTDEVIRLEKESRSKLSDLIRPFDYTKLNNLFDLFVSQRKKSSAQRYFSERSRLSHINVNNGKSKESFNKQTTLLEKRMDESIPLDKQCQSSLEIFKVKTYVNTIISVLGVYTELDEVTNLQCDYLELLEKCEGLETELSKSKMMSNSFESVQKHAINLELELQQCKEKIKNDMLFKLQDKGIVISELKKLIEKLKGKSVNTKFEKSSVIRQPNAFKSQRPSVLGKLTTFSNSLVRKDFLKSSSVTQTHVSNDFSKPVTAQTLPPNKKSILKNTNVLAPGMYKLHTDHNQTRTSQLPQDSRKTNKRVSLSTGVFATTSVSRPQLKSNPQGDRRWGNLDKMKEKGDECIFIGYSNQSRAYRVFNKRTRVIMESIHVNFNELPLMVSDQLSSDPAPECQTMAVNHDSLSPENQWIQHQTSVSRTPEQNSVVERRNHSRAYRVFNKRTRVIMESIHVNFDELPLMVSDQLSSDPAPECQTMAVNHDSLSPENQCQANVTQADRTITTSNELDLLFSPILNAKTLNVKSISMCDKCVLHDKHDMCVLKSIAKPIKRTVSSESNIKTRNFTRKIYEHVSKTCSWWYPKSTPSGYIWKPKSRTENVNPNLVEIVLFIVNSGCSKHMTGNLKLLINFVEKFMGTVKFGNDQIAPILGYGDLVQGTITIKRVYYVKGKNHNLFSVGQFCYADLEVALRKSMCFIRDLKGNDLLIGSHGTDLYSITLQDTNSPNPICLVAKVTSSQAWLWHRHLSHLNFDTINLLSKNDIVVGLPKMKFVKDHLYSSCTEFLNQTLHAYFAAEGILHQMSVAQTPEQNGVVERRNRTLVEAARTMLSAAKVPLFFWAEAIATACFTQNCSLVIQHHEKTPYHIINDQKPDGKNLDKMKAKETYAKNDQVADDEFINIFSTLIKDQGEMSSRHVYSSNIHTFYQRYPSEHHWTKDHPLEQVIDQGEMSSCHVYSSNMHTFYQRYPSEHHWTKDHPLEQVIGNPSQSVRTRRQLESDAEMCMFALTVSQTGPNNIKEAMADSAWIE